MPFMTYMIYIVLALIVLHFIMQGTKDMNIKYTTEGYDSLHNRVTKGTYLAGDYLTIDPYFYHGYQPYESQYPYYIGKYPYYQYKFNYIYAPRHYDTYVDTHHFGWY